PKHRHNGSMSKAGIIKLCGASAVLGVLVGLAADLFIRAMQLGTRLVWDSGLGAHPAPWAVVAVCAAGGVAMGLCVKLFGTNDDGIGFEAVLAAVKKDGELGLAQIKRVVLNAYAGLVTGASIGPESPLITIAGYAGDRLARILGTSRQQLM